MGARQLRVRAAQRARIIAETRKAGKENFAGCAHWSCRQEISGIPAITEPNVLPRAEHSISRSDISQAALKVLYTLKDAGYRGLLVGGGVRDLLAGLTPKDFDVATDATPEQTRPLFRSCRLIGRRFKLAHVRFGREIIEVSTFRGPVSDDHERDDSGRILSDNVYGSVEQDAFRRDFTVNGLYYDIADFSIIDYVGGLEDITKRQIRLIGDPETRYREDPVRMLRAIRIANKLGFQIETETAEPIKRLAPLLAEVPAARLFEEVLKVLLNKDAVQNLRDLRAHGLFEQLFPQTERILQLDESGGYLNFIEMALGNTAQRLVEDQPVSPAFLYGALLWPAVEQRYVELIDSQGHPPAVAMSQAGVEVLGRQVLRVAIPKRFGAPASEIWNLQTRFDRRRGKYPQRTMGHPRFRAAYDFLLLRAEIGYADPALAQWWTDAQENPELPPIEDEVDSAPPRRRRRRRRGGQKAKAGA